MRSFEDTQPTKPGKLRLSYLIVGATAALVLFAVFWQFRIGVLRDSIFQEVATHHLEHKAMDIETADFSVLEAALTKFEVNLSPQSPQTSGYRLEGGRYCSLNQRLAIQMQLRGKSNGKSATLYVTKVQNEIASIARAEGRNVGDVALQMWTESDSLFILATAAN